LALYLAVMVSHPRRSQEITTTMSKLRIALLASSTLAVSALAYGKGDGVTTNFQHELPNVPRKSLSAFGVTHVPGGSSDPHTRNRLWTRC
jgi:hypothetical protein